MRAVTADRAPGQGRTAAALRRASLTAALAVLVGWVGSASLEGSDVRLVPTAQRVGPPPAGEKSTKKVKDEAKDDEVKKPAKKAPKKEPKDEKKYAFNVQGQPWP